MVLSGPSLWVLAGWLWGAEPQGMPRLGDCLPPLRRPLPGSAVLIEDFELDPPGHWPQAWGALEDRRLRPITAQDTAAGRYPFRIRRECDNQFVRVRTEGIWTYVLYPNGERRIWNLHTHPVLYWNWRVRRLPRGAREDQRAIDDSAAGLMITFSVNALGVPRTIRYVWSSTLPVGTVLSKGVWGNLKIVVVASGPEGLNRWMSLVRDVRQDYRRLFGGEPPAIPLAIGLWSDSDSTQDQSEADFDNLIALPSAELAMRLLP